MGCCEPVLAPIENYYTKYQIDKMIASAVTSGCCITPEEVDEKIESAKTEIEAEIPSLSGYATEHWVLDKNYITGVDLSNYATKDEIPTVPTKVSAFENDVPYLTEHQSLSGYVTDAEMSAYTYDKQTIDDKIAQGGTFDPTQYYNTAQTNNLIESAVTRVEAEIPTVPTSNTAFTNDAGYLTEHQSLSGYATEQWVLDKHYITGVDLSDYTTKEYVSGFTYDKATIDEKVASGGTFDPTQYYNKTQTNELVESAVTRVEGEIPTVPTSNTAFTNDAGYLTEHQSLSGYATEQWVLDKHYISGVDLSDYALKSEIPIVPTSNTAFTNDAGYLTEHQSLSAYSTTDEVNSAITQATSGKANSSDVYLKSETSGATEIQNALNAKADPYSAGTGISIIDNVISATGGGGGGSYTAGRAIDLTNNVISFTLPISAGTGSLSVAENNDTIASGYWSHAEGAGSSATSYASHAEGKFTLAEGDSSHAEGIQTVAKNFAEHASGRYNNSSLASETFGDSGNTLFSVGNGTGSNARHNAFEIRQNGDIYIQSGSTDINLQNSLNSKADSSTLNNYLLKSKIWCGTESEYNSIVNKDSETLYLIHE